MYFTELEKHMTKTNILNLLSHQKNANQYIEKM